MEARVYSGRSGEIEATTVNAVPVTLLDIRLQANSTFEQELPASYNGLLVVLEGALSAGNSATALAVGQVSWLDRVTQAGSSVLDIHSGSAPTRVLLYAGEPQNIRLAARGPFIAGSESELARYFSVFRCGMLPRASSMRHLG